LLIEVGVFLERFLFLFARWFCFPATRTPIRPAAAGPFDQSDQVEEGTGARPI
jgi:hypothetical protein